MRAPAHITNLKMRNFMTTMTAAFNTGSKVGAVGFAGATSTSTCYTSITDSCYNSANNRVSYDINPTSGSTSSVTLKSNDPKIVFTGTNMNYMNPSTIYTFAWLGLGIPNTGRVCVGKSSG